MRTPSFALTVVGTLALLSGCGGGSPTDGGGGGGGGDAPFTASIAGQAWTADEIGFQVIAGSAQIPGSLTITGVQVQSATNYRTLSLALSFIPGTGTFPLGINTGTTPGGTGSVSVVAGASNFTSYSTPLSGNAGTVTITSLTSSRMAGTFSFTASNIVAAGSSVTVTNGEFDIALPAGFVVASGNNRGSTFTATIGGQPWVAATIVPVGQAGIFVAGGQNTQYSVSITPTLPVTPGIYPVGNGTTGITIQVIATGTANSWGPATGSIGTVTFTSTGGGRISGTFAAVLAPVGGTGGNLTVANAAFDIRAPGT
jgi:hypothetical protein